jgi:hypothetical protein
MDPLRHKTFHEFIAQKGVKPKVYKRNVEAIEATGLLETIEDMGDHIFVLAHRGLLQAWQAQQLLLDLTQCYADPISKTERIMEISKELRRFAE